ncbi:MAG: ECF transporter S component [Synergistaceae bacterium]|jgi:uncharacterized membrane protein|nr:ECF transporter S component [Synergistaceae bacterium]
MGEFRRESAKIREFAIASLLAAVIFLMTFTPIGFINLVVINATIVHVPVIIGSIILGPGWGACLGALFGAASLIRNTLTPTLLSFAFSPLMPVPGTGSGSAWALLICFGPRILVGVVPWYAARTFSAIRQNDKKWRFASLFAAGVAGSMTNTLLVMHILYFVFKDAYAQIRNAQADAVYGMVLSIITGNGIPEAIVAGVFAAAACGAVEAYRRRDG